MNISIHPFVLTAIIAALAASIAAGFAFRASATALRIILIAVAILCALPALYLFVLLNPGLIDARFRTYNAFYRDIREGMTRDEVFALVDRHYPPDGARQRPKVMSDEPAHLGFFMSPESSREPNCEGIFLRLSGGRITKKDYSPD